MFLAFLLKTNKKLTTNEILVDKNICKALTSQSAKPKNNMNNDMKTIIEMNPTPIKSMISQDK